MRNIRSPWRPVAASAAVLALAACSPPHPHAHSDALLKTISQLDCPGDQDDLKLDKAAADGRSCLYSGPGGAQVTLRLIDLKGGDASAALAPLTADLRSELPANAGKGDDDKDKVDIDLPGIHIHASGDEGARKAAAAPAAQSGGATATTGAPASSNSVVAEERTSVQIGHDQKGVVINAGDNGAEIHVSSGGSGTRLMFVLASETPGPHGFRFAGYEARGPVAGPLAVVSVKSNGDEHDELQHAMRALLRRNVGG